MLYSLWWLLLGWVGWFVYDKKFLRDRGDGVDREAALTGSSELADSLAEAETDLQAYSAELARVTDELAETTQAYQRSSEQVGELRKTVARLEREMKRGGRPAREDGESDSAEAPTRAGGRRAGARKAEAAAAQTGAGAPLLFPMKPLGAKSDEQPAAAEPAADGEVDRGSSDAARAAKSPTPVSQTVAVASQDRHGDDRAAAVPPPLPPPSRLISALQSLSAKADADGAQSEPAAAHQPPFGAQR